MYYPKISICVPFHWMNNWGFFLERCLKSIEAQTFKDYEIILIKYSTMPATSNRVIESAKGKVIKMLYMDDWLDSPNYLMEIYKAFLEPEINWLITSSTTNKDPRWTDNVETGNNKLGSPSALAFRNREGKFLFDENLSWLLDCDLYKRLEKNYGKPAILTGNDVMVGIGVHEGQMTNILTNEEKIAEHFYMQKKYL